jgi:subtilisin family serine protease
MKFSSSRSWNGVVLTAIATFLVLPAVASAADFVLTAPQWGKKQDRAVAAAGGTILWSHAGTGLASVSSDNPDFLASVEASKAFRSMAEDMMIQWQKPSPVRQSDINPDDEYFYSQGLQWNMAAIEAPEAWDAHCTGSGVRVAINDGGIDPTHPDLAPNMDTSCSVSFVPDEPFDSDTGGFWHGMHVAGIVGAANNGVALMGVAPEATMISVKVLHDGTGSFGQVIGGILYASNPAAFGMASCDRADIINMSLGAVFNKRLPGGGPLVAALNRAVNFATSQGTLVVSAAGNDGIDFGQARDLISVPAESGNGLSIAATGPVDWVGAFGPPGNVRAPASYSNYGEGMTTVAAPGGAPGITAVVNVNAPQAIAGAKPATSAFYGPPASGETGDVALWTDPADTSGDPHDACEGGIDPNVAGKIALIHRGACAFVDKTANAEASGAIGVIIANNRAGAMPGLGGDSPATIPSVGISQANGAAIEGELGGGVNATLNDNPAGVYDQVLSACKVGWCFAYGTSMASPAAAGVAALILGENPGMSVAALKTRLAQTADDEGKIGNDEFYGHGFVNAARACGVK